MHNLVGYSSLRNSTIRSSAKVSSDSCNLSRDNVDGTWSILTTIMDHGAPPSHSHLGNTLQLAALSRELSANDPQNNLTASTGSPLDRNTELLIDNPLA